MSGRVPLVTRAEPSADSESGSYGGVGLAIHKRLSLMINHPPRYKRFAGSIDRAGMGLEAVMLTQTHNLINSLNLNELLRIIH